MLKRIDFVRFLWILIVLFNFGNIYSPVSADVDVRVDENANVKPGDMFYSDETQVNSLVINKCDSNSFNFTSDVQRFTSVFGYFDQDWYLDFKFISSFNRSKNRCKAETVEIPFNFTSTLTSENETAVFDDKPVFWNYGFFNHTLNYFINPENYCVKKLESSKTSQWILTVEICGQPDSNTNLNSIHPDFPPTLQKCCEMDGFLTTGKNKAATCHYSQHLPWKPTLMKNKGINPNYNFSLPCPNASLLILPYQLEGKVQREKYSPIIFKDVRVLENGQVETRDTLNHTWEKLESSQYCIDGYIDQLTSDEIDPLDGIRVESFMVIQCPPKESESAKIKDMVVTVLVFISSFVLLLIVVVFGLTWKQQNIHGWTKAAFCLSMFLWFFCTGVRLVHTKLDGFCMFIAVATHFFQISAFCWMLMVNFDLWATISSMTTANQRSNGHKRFLCYCLFSLAIPTIVVTISLIIEHQFSPFDDRVIRPNYGKSRCFLDLTAVPAYSIYPTIILFLPNFIFISLTTKIVMGMKRGRKRLQGENSAITTTTEKSNNAEMILCLKLFVIMGISWIFEIISGLAETGTEVSWYWFIFDIYNFLQPFFLFWLFVCNKTIREQLSDKYSLFKAAFKWLEVHLPCYFSTSASDQSESRAKKSTATTFTTIRD